jgi:hypothetical protein
MRRLWLVLLLLAAIPLGACEAIGGLYSASLWVPGLFLVLIIWGAAMIAIKVRSG